MAFLEGNDTSETYRGVSNETNLIFGRGGDDTLTGGELADSIHGEAGNDTVFGRDGADTLTGGDGDDILSGGPGADVLRAGAGSDLLGGGPGDDSLQLNLGAVSDLNSAEGNSGDDLFVAGPGADQIDGGTGQDEAYYGASGAGVFVDLGSGRGVGGYAEGDTLRFVEDVEGSRFDDTLVGDGRFNELRSFGGNDLVRGGPGGDLLEGGFGSDTLDYRGSDLGVRIDLRTGAAHGGDAQGDVIVDFENAIGSAHADLLIGDAGANRFAGQPGRDALVGGDGDDVLIGGAGADRLLGGAARDLLIGGGGGDLLAGGSGADALRGGGGRDTLRGGGDADEMTGGGGADRFVFRATSESGPGRTARDAITDFSRAEGDLLDLGAIDADTAARGDQDFRLIGTAAFGGVSGELRLRRAGDDSVVLADVNGDRVADFAVTLESVARLIPDDFVL